MIINPYSFGVGGGVSGTISLMHFDGVDGSQTFTDETGKIWTSGGAEHDNSQSVFGGSSAFWTPANSGTLYTPDHADWDFGSGDFTLEGRFRFDNFANSKGILSKPNSGTTFSPWVLFTLGGDLVFFSSSNNSSWDVASAVVVGAAIADDTWYAWAVSRVGSSIYLLFDGTLTNTVSFAGTLMDSDGQVNLGYHVTPSTHTMHGWQDEFRAVKGTGLYTGNYTLAASPFAYP